MKRRHFLRTASVATAAGLSAAACGKKTAATAGGPSSPEATSATAGPQAAEYKWKMVTTWPSNFPALGTGAQYFAETIEKCSNGRIKIKVYGANELVPALEVFDAVSRGIAELGHAGAYYWKGKTESASFFSAVPFGLTSMEMNAWLYFGGGLELWQETYAPFGLLPVPCGNSNCQMGGWFNKEINTVADLKGLKMRIPGLGGEVLARAGATTVTLAGGEIFTALQTGTIDAAEWVGPYNDLAFGLYKAAKYYYYPGWHEPGSTLEGLINKKAFDALPKDLQTIVLTAAQATNDRMLAEFNARSPAALASLINDHKVQLRAFPNDVLKLLRDLSHEVVQEKAAKDAQFKKVYDSFLTFQRAVIPWTRISDQAFVAARAL